MLQRLRPFRALASSLLLVLPLLTLGNAPASSLLRPNDPVSIGEAAGDLAPASMAVSEADAPVVPVVDSTNLPARSTVAESAAQPNDAPAIAEPLPQPKRDVRALGRPNGMFSARPAAAETSEGPGLLARLDPRQNEMLRVSAALGGVLVLIVLVRMFVRRTGGAPSAGRPSGVVEILARYPVARSQQLVLVKVARRILLLHQSGGAMVTLSEIADRDEVAGLLSRLEAGSRQKDSQRFRSLLRGFEREHWNASMTESATGAGSGDQVIDLTRRRRGPASAWRGTKREVA